MMAAPPQPEVQYTVSPTAEDLHHRRLHHIPNQHRQLPRSCLSVSFQEFGDTSSPHVAFCNHGIPGCRIFEGLVLDGEAKRVGLRIIVVERPGYAQTPFHPSHSVAGWAGVIQELADELKLDRFSVMGASGGGPFTAACARFIPPERLVAILLVCPLGSFLQNPAPPLELRLMMGVRFLPRWVGDIAVGLARFRMSLDRAYFLKHAHTPVDREALRRHPAVATAMQMSVVEALGAGSSGVAHELTILRQPWGFRLHDIPVKRVYMWVGMKDNTVPLASSAVYQQIPSCKVFELEEDAHISIAFSTARVQMETLKEAHLAADAADAAGSTAPSK